VSARDVLWSLIGLGIGGMTTWGNVEFWRHRRRGRAATRSGSDMSKFSHTIDEYASRPMIKLGGLEVRRPKA
jgi:hypothetical protein